MTDDGGTNLATNLRRLCSRQPSISFVCKRMGVNRQQFNKYLTGRTIPSVSALQRICGYFAIEIDQLFDSPEQLFRSTNGGPIPTVQAPENAAILDKLAGLIQPLMRANDRHHKRLIGTYLRYHYAFDGSGRIVRSLFRISEHDGLLISRLFERLNHRTNGSGRLTTFKYYGVICLLSECIFNIEYEKLLHSCVGYSAFAFPRRPAQKFLIGLQSSYSSESGKPTTTRVVLERQDHSRNVKDLLRSCRIFDPDEAIDPDIRDLIDNSNSGAFGVFSAQRGRSGSDDIL